MISADAAVRVPEQSRARYPDADGFVERDGVRTYWERYGEGDPTIFFVPPWAIVHSRCWKMQVPFLARHFRVVTFDPRGNGRSDRPLDPEAYAEAEYAADALAVLDASETGRAIVVTLSLGAQRSLLLAQQHPERVEGLFVIGAAVPLAEPHDYRLQHSFDDELEEHEGWAKYNRHHWLRDYEDFLWFFFENAFSEPHSTKGIEDAVGWGLETTPDVLVATQIAKSVDEDGIREAAAQVQCPVVVLHGDRDRISPHARSVALAGATGGTLVTLEGAGHMPHARDPVQVNKLLREFADSVRPPRPPARSWRRAKKRRRRALYVSSPIGLGHARRDVAIAQELRKLVPDLEIDWLAQSPVTNVLQAEGERIHPASALLANESSHIESECSEHDLHAFQAIRRMDEILCANFMLFHDVVRDYQYDLWIGDEAWEVDYYLHENPEEKRAAYVWLTDFVGWLPMPDGGERESFVASDYNAEMIEHIARFPRVRDRAIFVGNADDIVGDAFGPDLPLIRSWTEAHYDFAGYITGFDPAAFADRAALRAELGYRPDEQVCIVTVGGSGVGLDLLRRVISAFPEAKARVPALRMVVVAGPRIDLASLPPVDGLEVHAYVHELYRHLAACDLAVVQGGLTTTMELTANRRPFLYFPLRHHFEQNFHVRNRLDRYDAGRCMDFDASTPDVIAAAIAEEIGREVDYRGVEADGAPRAAALIAELL
jgi:pimeloyl-ACP methyl ester carboxylesterase/predicted glycosyltransferase